MNAMASNVTGRLIPEQVKSFIEEGYLIMNDVFDRDELQPLRREFEGRIDVKARELHAAGKLTTLHSGCDFDHRVARIYADDIENGEAILRDLEGLGGGGHCGIEMFKIITHPKLLAAIESLVGPEIVASSAYRLRPKIPGKYRGVMPWHQDSGYFSAHCDDHLIVTVWIPLVNATEHNGCMKILPRAHRSGIARHHSGGPAGFLAIDDKDLPAHPHSAVTAEVPLGGAIFMTNLTPHCSTPNFSNHVRWSVDLRYQAADVPNNIGVMPNLFADASPEVLMACYPPEADFIVQSKRDPKSVEMHEQFARRRAHYDAVQKKAYPKRDWTRWV